MKKISLILVFFVLVVPLFSAKFNCKVDSGKTGSVDGIIVDFGTILWADKDGGWTTKIRWPGKFYSKDLHTTWSKDNVSVPGGTFKLKIKVKLAGNRKYGFWKKKRNRVILKLFNASGTKVAEVKKDVRVSRPKTYTLYINWNASSGYDKEPFTLKLDFHKWDGGSDDGNCSYSISIGKR